MYFCFVNHSKYSIVGAEKNAKLNIAKSLGDTIRDNSWSITDHIEFIDMLRYDKSKIKELIEDQYYHCDPKYSHYFYF